MSKNLASYETLLQKNPLVISGNSTGKTALCSRKTESTHQIL